MQCPLTCNSGVRSRPHALPARRSCARTSVPLQTAGTKHLLDTCKTLHSPVPAATAVESASTGVGALLAANVQWIIAVAAGALCLIWVIKALNEGSRKYDGNVGEEYDAWTREGILEYYWGEHIHLGYYNKDERGEGDKRWKWKKDFKQAKYDFIDEMFKWSGSQQPRRILDVGCGFGGTSRYLAKMFPDAEVRGITLSPEQVKRGTELAKERGLNNVTFEVMDALNMKFEDEQFDLVWACESGEHMPDKKKYVEEMTRVLKPGGTLAIACWCQRKEGNKPFTQKELDDLQFLYDEWAHPFFISKEEFVRLMEGTGKLESCATEDWCEETLPSWRQSIWVGVVDPWPVIFKFNPLIWYKVVREIVCLERMHQAFYSGLMEYGMMKAVKTVSSKTLPGATVSSAVGGAVPAPMSEFTRPSGLGFRGMVFADNLAASVDEADDALPAMSMDRPSGGAFRSR